MAGDRADNMSYNLVRDGEGPGRFVSSLLERGGLVHGFGTRLGGVSPKGRASLNFGLKNGDAPETVAENLRLLAAAAGFEPERFFRARQVHGDTVLEATAQTRPAELIDTAADALITGEPGITVGVVTADCVPVLFAGLDGAGRPRAVGAAHAGWRGVVGGVLEALLLRLERRFGCSPDAVRAAVGPCIGVERYEVGPEVAEQFAGIEGAVDETRGERPHLNLRAAVRKRLEAAGVASGAISGPGGLCTFSDAEHFFSYRRHGVGTGLQLSFVGLQAG